MYWTQEENGKGMEYVLFWASMVHKHVSTQGSSFLLFPHFKCLNIMNYIVKYDKVVLSHDPGSVISIFKSPDSETFGMNPPPHLPQMQLWIQCTCCQDVDIHAASNLLLAVFSTYVGSIYWRLSEEL